MPNTVTAFAKDNHTIIAVQVNAHTLAAARLNHAQLNALIAQLVQLRIRA